MAPSGATASETARFINAPAIAGSQSPKLAVQYELKISLPEGRGLARTLLDAGVDGDDAAFAARLAAGHLGEGLGGCEAKVSISRASIGGAVRVERISLVTMRGSTVIERRSGQLTIASETGSLAPLV